MAVDVVVGERFVELVPRESVRSEGMNSSRDEDSLEESVSTSLPLTEPANGRAQGSMVFEKSAWSYSEGWLDI